MFNATYRVWLTYLYGAGRPKVVVLNRSYAMLVLLVCTVSVIYFALIGDAYLVRAIAAKLLQDGSAKAPPSWGYVELLLGSLTVALLLAAVTKSSRQFLGRMWMNFCDLLFKVQSRFAGWMVDRKSRIEGPAIGLVMIATAAIAVTITATWYSGVLQTRQEALEEQFKDLVYIRNFDERPSAPMKTLLAEDSAHASWPMCRSFTVVDPAYDIGIKKLRALAATKTKEEYYQHLESHCYEPMVPTGNEAPGAAGQLLVMRARGCLALGAQGLHVRYTAKAHALLLRAREVTPEGEAGDKDRRRIDSLIGNCIAHYIQQWRLIKSDYDWPSETQAPTPTNATKSTIPFEAAINEAVKRYRADTGASVGAHSNNIADLIYRILRIRYEGERDPGDGPRIEPARLSKEAHRLLAQILTDDQECRDWIDKHIKLLFDDFQKNPQPAYLITRAQLIALRMAIPGSACRGDNHEECEHGDLAYDSLQRALYRGFADSAFFSDLRYMGMQPLLDCAVVGDRVRKLLTEARGQ